MVRFWSGRDFLRCSGGWAIGFYAFRRRAQPGEIRWRLSYEVSVSVRPFRLINLLRLWPAWSDEPTALAEYERTMRAR